MIHRLIALSLLMLALLPVQAQEFSWSAYGTLGYARTNRAYGYLRGIDSSGSFDADSVLGAQGDLHFTPQWSATVQMKLARSLEDDSRWDLKPAWAFVAWRPSDDWLLRAGRMRVPLYLQSESMDVGVTHDMARLPVEMYSLVPSTDFNGISVAKSWSLGASDLSLDAYAGRINTTARFWMRDGALPVYGPGANFVGVRVDSSGAVLTLRSPEGLMRGGVHQVRTRRSNGGAIPVRFPFVEIAPGVGYYQVDNAIPGPGLEAVSGIRNMIWTAGLDQAIAPNWRITAEFARIVQNDIELGSDSRGGYVALMYQMGKATPYLSWGRLRSSDGTISWYERLTRNRLPPYVPGAEQLNAAQRAAGEAGYSVDQTSTSLGASYAIDANQKLKFEWQHTRVGRVSRFVDTPPGQEPPSHTSIEIFSINYNFSF